MLKPDAYTIDTGGEGITPDVAQEIVDLCDKFNFARVVNAYNPQTFDRLTDQVDAYYTKRESTGDAKDHHRWRGDQRYQSAPYNEKIIANEFPELLQIAQDTSSVIHEAGQATERMATPHSDIKKLIVNTYPPRGRIKKHWDDESGVALIASIRGQAKTWLGAPKTFNPPGFAITTGEAIAKFTSGENELLVMPARVGERGGLKDQTQHRMINATPRDLSIGGIRRTVAMIYGARGNSVQP